MPSLSAEHPASISPVIPMELLRIVSAHITRNDDSSPIMLDLPSSYFLDRVISHPSGVLPEKMAVPVLNRLSNVAEEQVSARSPTHPLTYSSRLSHIFWSNPTLRRSIQLAGSHSYGKRCRPVSVVAQSTLLSAEKVKTQICPPDTKDQLRRSLSTSSVSKQPLSGAPVDNASLAVNET